MYKSLDVLNSGGGVVLNSVVYKYSDPRVHIIWMADKDFSEFSWMRWQKCHEETDTLVWFNAQRRNRPSLNVLHGCSPLLSSHVMKMSTFGNKNGGRLSRRRASECAQKVTVICLSWSSPTTSSNRCHSHIPSLASSLFTSTDSNLVRHQAFAIWRCFVGWTSTRTYHPSSTPFQES